MTAERQPGLWRAAARAASWPARTYGRAVHASFNPTPIRAEAENIRRLWSVLRSPAPQHASIMTAPDRSIDVRLTAEVAGITVEQVEALLALRLRRTADAFWASGAAAALGFVGALSALPSMVSGGSALWATGITLILLLALGLHGLQAALHNWQIRAMRLGGLMDYLAAGSMLPRRRTGPRLP